MVEISSSVPWHRQIDARDSSFAMLGIRCVTHRYDVDLTSEAYLRRIKILCMTRAVTRHIGESRLALVIDMVRLKEETLVSTSGSTLL